MRIRVVKPDYWHDRLMASFRADVREFYIGLWMVADDAGWLRWRPEEIAAELYPYRGVKVRERQVGQWGGQLVQAGRLVIHVCGHAVIPTLSVHQRTGGGSRTTKHRDSHLLCPSTDKSVQIRTSTDKSVGKGREGKGRERKDSVVPFHRQGLSA